MKVWVSGVLQRYTAVSPAVRGGAGAPELQASVGYKVSLVWGK